MFKRFAILLAVIGILCAVGSAMAMPMECSNFAVQEWMTWNGIAVPAGCFNDTSTDWAIHVNLDNNDPDFDNEEEVLSAVCVKAINRCNTTHGTDVASCVIARDNHCNYNPCARAWKPYCNSTNNCMNAYDYCSGYLSDGCIEAAWACAFGDTAKCQFYYGTCGVRSCVDIWKPFCDQTNNCYISYKYCNQYLSDACRTAGVGCAFIGDPAYCQQYYDCGVRSCVDIWKPFCDQTNNCYISDKYCNHYLSDYCQNALDICAIGEPKSAKFCTILHNTCKVP